MEKDRENTIIADNKKRKNYIVWDEYFMAIALLEVNRNKNSGTDAAIILNERKIIISSSSNFHDTANLHGNHAEFRALQNVQRGTTMYTTSLPCEECAKLIAQKGIVEVVYAQERDNNRTKDIFEDNAVTCRKFIFAKDKIVLEL